MWVFFTNIHLKVQLHPKYWRFPKILGHIFELKQMLEFITTSLAFCCQASRVSSVSFFVSSRTRLAAIASLFSSASWAAVESEYTEASSSCISFSSNPPTYWMYKNNNLHVFLESMSQQNYSSFSNLQITCTEITKITILAS